jgi:formylglycine-generating enzyme required for sulfatase activity
VDGCTASSVGDAFAVRGGSWINNPENARAAYRNRRQLDKRNQNHGFRLLLSS